MASCVHMLSTQQLCGTALQHPHVSITSSMLSSCNGAGMAHSLAFSRLEIAPRNHLPSGFLGTRLSKIGSCKRDAVQLSMTKYRFESLVTNAHWPSLITRSSGKTSGGQKWVCSAGASDASEVEGQGASLEATSAGALEGDKDEGSRQLSTLQLGTYFGLWYLYNIIFNIYNKKTLNVFNFPWLLASFQLLAGGIWMLGLWGLKLQPCPPVNKEFLRALLLPAFFHTVGHIAACVSFSKVAVSFTHIVKSAEPVFSVIFSSFLGQTYPIGVWLSLLPIVGGVSLAALTEVSFNVGGLSTAMISNVGFVLRNIYSKKSLTNFKEFDGINLYGWITWLSFIYLFPVAIVLEGSQWVTGYKQAIVTVGQASTFHLWVIVSGIFYHLYNQSSYQALDGISPLTFSVGNTMKRVVVIIASVIAFRNPIQPLNAVGSAIAIFGTFLYSHTNQKPKAKAA